jgi:hypothetical protein
LLIFVALRRRVDQVTIKLSESVVLEISTSKLTCRKDSDPAGGWELLVGGITAIRISVSSWATTEEDVDRSLKAMVRSACECGV